MFKVYFSFFKKGLLYLMGVKLIVCSTWIITVASAFIQRLDFFSFVKLIISR